MILQVEFENSGYTDLLAVDVASEYRIDLEGLFDLDKKPAELLGLYFPAGF